MATAALALRAFDVSVARENVGLHSPDHEALWPVPDAAPRWGRLSARALDLMTFEPVRFVVPHLIPEGLALFAGKPKLGKSWAALDIAVAVASGGNALGGRQCEIGDVFYGAFEDSNRRLQERLRKLCPSGDLPERLTIETNARMVGDGLEAALIEWTERAAAPRLIILDTLRCIRPSETGRGSAYSEDAAAIAPLLNMARERQGLAIIVVHHVRKMESDDPFETISGTHGLTGVADTLLVLAREGDRFTLHGKGRDLDDYSKALERDRATGSWRIIGDARELAKTGERQEVVDALREAGEPMNATGVTDAIGGKHAAVRRMLARMAKDGSIVRTKKRGFFTLPETGCSDDGPNGPMCPDDDE